MSESHPPQTEKTATVGREQLRVRVEQLRRSRQHGMFGVPELVGLAASGLMLLAVVFAYFYFLTPAQARSKAIEAERAHLQERLRVAEAGINPNASLQASVDEINQSLEKFESEALMQRATGRMDLYGELNAMMRKHGLRNTAGPVYTALDALGSPGAPTTAAKTGSARWQSLYPGIGIAVTVEGPYANLRRFLREVEASKQFIIINAVELEGVSDANSQTGAALVSLHLDMATYFRRESAPTDLTPASATR
ncbi:MAG TPA: GspMb/PilO family protein [Pyrinomonadaceae bacterium]